MWVSSKSRVQFWGIDTGGKCATKRMYNSMRARMCVCVVCSENAVDATKSEIILITLSPSGTLSQLVVENHPACTFHHHWHIHMCMKMYETNKHKHIFTRVIFLCGIEHLNECGFGIAISTAIE